MVHPTKPNSSERIIPSHFISVFVLGEGGGVYSSAKSVVLGQRFSTLAAH